MRPTVPKVPTAWVGRRWQPDLVSLTMPAGTRDGETRMTDREAPTERLFAIVRAEDGRMVNLCPGPALDGTCPRATTATGLVPCAGTRVVPLHGSSADGLPFTVAADAHGTVCPMHWIDQ